MKKRLPLFALTAALALPGVLSAQEAKTVPVGVMTVTIAGSSNGTVYNQTAISVPLLEANGISGQSKGRITAVTSNSISNADAAWTASALSQVGAPYFINITSGTNAGRMFQITANTATQLTVNSQGLDLTTLGFSVGASGDTYEIVQGNTLLGILGTPTDGVVGGTSAQFQANTIDKVAVTDPNNGNTFTYYFDTSSGVNQWRRLGSGVNQGNLVISPKSGLHYSRISVNPLSIQFVGAVPSTQSVHQVQSLGTTILANSFPADTTLLASGIHSIPGWRSANANGVTVANSDRVVLKVGTNFFSYYFDATSGVNQWRRAGSGLDQGSVVIPAGSAIRFVRSGTVGQSSTWTRNLPYSIN